MARQDPLRNFRYRLEIDSLEQAAFSEVAMGDLSNDRSSTGKATRFPPSGSSAASPNTPT